MSKNVMGWQVRDEQASKELSPDLRGTLAHLIPGAPCCLAKAAGWTLSHGPVGIHTSCMLCSHCHLMCSTSMREVLNVVCAGKVLEGWHVFPLPLDTHKDWPNLQHGFEQLPGCGAEALDTPAFYRWCARQQTWWLGVLHAAL